MEEKLQIRKDEVENSLKEIEKKLLDLVAKSRDMKKEYDDLSVQHLKLQSALDEINELLK